METIEIQAKAIMQELIQESKLTEGDLIVVGCSSSEVIGQKIGTDSDPNTAQEIFNGLLSVCKEHGIYLAAQCCEHLNRALIVEQEAAKSYHLPPVNVVPQPKAGGSFATAAYHTFAHPVAVETLHHQAAAGLDIGGTLIGMHLCPVAVPLRLSTRKLGEAILLAARTRPKFIGGNRAVYDENLL